MPDIGEPGHAAGRAVEKSHTGKLSLESGNAGADSLLGQPFTPGNLGQRAEFRHREKPLQLSQLHAGLPGGPLMHFLATAYVDRFTSNEGGIVGGEECGGCGRIIRQAYATQRYTLGDALTVFLH